MWSGLLGTSGSWTAWLVTLKYNVQCIKGTGLHFNLSWMWQAWKTLEAATSAVGAQTTQTGGHCCSGLLLGCANGQITSNMNPGILSICVDLKSTAEQPSPNLSTAPFRVLCTALLPPSPGMHCNRWRPRETLRVESGLGDSSHAGTAQLNTIPAQIRRERAQICRVLNYMMKRNNRSPYILTWHQMKHDNDSRKIKRGRRSTQCVILLSLPQGHQNAQIYTGSKSDWSNL